MAAAQGKGMDWRPVNPAAHCGRRPFFALGKQGQHIGGVLCPGQWIGKGSSRIDGGRPAAVNSAALGKEWNGSSARQGNGLAAGQSGNSAAHCGRPTLLLPAAFFAQGSARQGMDWQQD